MAEIHRNTDLRSCGATTIVTGNSTVFSNDLLIAVEGDMDSHGNGALISKGASTVLINDKKVIVVGDDASPDDAGHPDPSAASGSSNVFAGN